MPIKINDLELNEELDNEAMKATFGGRFGGGGFQQVPSYSGSMLGPGTDYVTSSRNRIIAGYTEQWTHADAYRRMRKTPIWRR